MSTLRLHLEIDFDGDPDHATITKYRNGLMNAVREMSSREEFVPENANGDIIEVHDTRVSIA